MLKHSDFAAFEAIGALVAIFDVDGALVSWNASCSTLTGYPFEQVRGRLLGDLLLVLDEREAVQDAFAETRAAKHATETAHHWVTSSGERRWIAWSNTVSPGPDGQPQYIVTTGFDQTAHRRAERAMQTSAATLDGIIRVATDAIVCIDADHRIVMFNHGAETIFGWSAAEVLGQPLETLLPARLRAVHARHMQEFSEGTVVARQMGERRPIMGLRRNGEEFPAEAAISRLDVGGIQLLTVVLRDVTRQKQRDAEQKFLAEVGAVLMGTLDYEEMLTTIAQLVVHNLATCCIIEIDTDDGLQRKRVIHRDPARKDLCERLALVGVANNRSHLAQAAIMSRLPSVIHDVTPEYLKTVAHDEAHLELLSELAPRAVLAFPLMANGHVFGALTLITSSAVDAHDVRVAEELALRAGLAIENARLYEHVVLNTTSLRQSNEQMAQATIHAQQLTIEAQELTVTANAATARSEKSERELIDVAEFRERFIGIVGHDLRNPLSSISMGATLLRERGQLDAVDERALARMVRSADRMKRMISQLLDLTRGRLGGGFPLDVRCVNLRELCCHVAGEFSAPITIAVDGAIIGTWDPDRLEEAMSNIVGNAIDYATAGTPVGLTAHVDGAEIVIIISNQGKTIPADVLPFIFEPFRQAQRHKSEAGNLGLGLYIASQIALSHGGTLNASSSGGTTSFSIRLPLNARSATTHSQGSGATTTTN